MEPSRMVLEQGCWETNVVQEVMHGLCQSNGGLCHVMQGLLQEAEEITQPRKGKGYTAQLTKDLVPLVD